MTEPIKLTYKMIAHGNNYVCMAWDEDGPLVTRNILICTSVRKTYTEARKEMEELLKHHPNCVVHYFDGEVCPKDYPILR